MQPARANIFHALVNIRGNDGNLFHRVGGDVAVVGDDDGDFIGGDNGGFISGSGGRGCSNFGRGLDKIDTIT